MATELTKRHFYEFCRCLQRNRAHAEVVRNAFNAAPIGSSERRLLRATVTAVWSVNRMRAIATRSFFDAAMWCGAAVVPLLQACRSDAWLTRIDVPGTARCDLTGQMVASSWVLSVGGVTQVVRADLAAVVVNFHTLTWYLEYVSSLTVIDDVALFAELQAMIESLHAAVRLTADRQTDAPPPPNSPAVAPAPPSASAC